VNGPTLLVVGAQDGSLGARISVAAGKAGFGEVHTAGLGTEEHACDVRNTNALKEVLRLTNPDYVVCTVGVNQPAGMTASRLRMFMGDSFETNVTGPMELLRLFLDMPQKPSFIKKFVAISSNSARIARTQSIPYCASKAALSMALRVAARETARWETRVLIWGYEPGLLADTPMTHETVAQWGDVPLHRMPGVGAEGLNANTLADRVVLDLAHSSVGYHGVLFPFDAGEQ